MRQPIPTSARPRARYRCGSAGAPSHWLGHGPTPVVQVIVVSAVPERRARLLGSVGSLGDTWCYERATDLADRASSRRGDRRRYGRH